MANAQIEVNFLENGRGGYYLLQSGHKFSIRTRKQERVYWKCVRRDLRCPATIATVDNIPVRNLNQHHNHEPEHHALAADAFVVNLKKRCRDEITPIPSLYDEELGLLRNREFDDDVKTMIEKIPCFENLKSTLYNHRAKNIPKLPSSQQEIDLQGEWKETCAGDRFLLNDDFLANGNRILIFSTDRNLEFMCQASVLFVDGTFYSCPGLFYQLYTIHGRVFDTVFPFIYSLLPNKNEHTYNHFFNRIKQAFIERNLMFSPSMVMFDFEIAAKNAFKNTFPEVAVKSCFFHFTQCVWRKTQACGLASKYSQNDDVKKLVRRAAVLPLVPLEHVEDVWFHALEESEDHSPEMTKFKDYITETWVENGDRASWNHFDNDGPRTTNHVEGWHSKVNKLCSSAHPNIYNIVKLMKSIQSTNESKIIQLEAGSQPRRKKAKYRHIDSRIQVLKNRLRHNEIDVYYYADSASYLLHID